MLFATYTHVRKASVKLATNCDDIPNPWNTRPTIITDKVLKFKYNNVRKILILFHFKYSHVSIGKNDAGPTKQNPMAIKTLPKNATSFGLTYLSTRIPQNGAVNA